jgi:dynactin 1
MSKIKVGQSVSIIGDPRRGIVRFVGPTRFQTGDWVGVELDTYEGKNDGSVAGVRYFDTEQGRGMFLRPAALAIMKEAPPPERKSAVKPKPTIAPPVGRRASNAAVNDPAAGRRMSLNAPSPSPVRTSRPSSIARVCLAAISRPPFVCLLT